VNINICRNHSEDRYEVGTGFNVKFVEDKKKKKNNTKESPATVLLRFRDK
jgi:hypothetical protein